MTVTRNITERLNELREGPAHAEIKNSGTAFRANVTITQDFNDQRTVQYYMFRGESKRHGAFVRLKLHEFPNTIHLVDEFRFTFIRENDLSLKRVGSNLRIDSNDALRCQVTVVERPGIIEISYKGTTIEISRDKGFLDIKVNDRFKTRLSVETGLFSTVEHVSPLPEILRGKVAEA
jgi:hypothetical protein